MEIVIGLKDLLDARRTKRTDQLLLEVGIAHVEAKPLQVFAREVRAKSRALEGPPKHWLLAGIAETSKTRGTRSESELVEELADAMGAAEALDPDAFGDEIDPAPLGERLDRDLVALTFDDHDRLRVGPVHVHRCQEKTPRERGFSGGRYWARTSDPQLVELVLSQLS